MDKTAGGDRRARVDVAIILGKDQQEIFPQHSPSIAIYSGAEAE
ncbi:MAG: hypothetical protein QM777_05675 [Pseudorhodoferax sp.]